MRAFDDNQTVEEVRVPIIDTFRRLEIIKEVLSKSARDAKKERLKASKFKMKTSLKGWCIKSKSDPAKNKKCFICE